MPHRRYAAVKYTTNDKCYGSHPEINAGRAEGLKIQQAFAAPDANYSYLPRITPVHHPKRWMVQFTQERLPEFGYNPPRVGMHGQQESAMGLST